jgi:hypothetical protein
LDEGVVWEGVEGRGCGGSGGHCGGE